MLRQIAELERSKAQMGEELRVLRVKLGDLKPGDRAAIEARYDMLGKMERARNEIEAFAHVEQEAHNLTVSALARMRRALKK
jgi:hypothetical protein